MDDVWLIPHFEKMLYDQAALARVLPTCVANHRDQGGDRSLTRRLATYFATSRTRPVVSAVLRTQTPRESRESSTCSPRRSFEEILGPDLADQPHGGTEVTREGNFEHHTSILHRPVRGDLARPTPVEDARQRLSRTRSARVRPAKDDKNPHRVECHDRFCAVRSANATGNAQYADAALASRGSCFERCDEATAGGCAHIEVGRPTISPWRRTMRGSSNCSPRLPKQRGIRCGSKRQ